MSWLCAKLAKLANFGIVKGIKDTLLGERWTHLRRNLTWDRIKSYLREHLLHTEMSATRRSLSVANGVFFGMLPIYGFHGLSAIAVAYLTGLSKAISFVFTRISFPLVAPFIITAEYIVGSWVMGEKPNFHFLSYTPDQALALGKNFIIGSIICAIVCSLVSFIVTKTILEVTQRAKKRRRKPPPDFSTFRKPSSVLVHHLSTAAVSHDL